MLSQRACYISAGLNCQMYVCQFLSRNDHNSLFSVIVNYSSVNEFVTTTKNYDKFKTKRTAKIKESNAYK